MKTLLDLRRRARENWHSDLVDDAINQANQRKWVRAVLMLGEKWLLAKPVN
jgi:hypothetical protein